ncbi:MAG: hypothetical protein GYA55_05815, partial [SAR324 cluster bacterium]|nr:hypothetical protein [SAR324 cluster bacterium]
LQNARLESDLFALTSQGRISFDAELDLKASIVLSAELSRGLAERVKELKKVLAANGTLTIPLELRGKGRDVIVTPDLDGLMRIGAQKVLKENAEKLLNKATKGLGKALGF